MKIAIATVNPITKDADVYKIISVLCFRFNCSRVKYVSGIILHLLQKLMALHRLLRHAKHAQQR